MRLLGCLIWSLSTLCSFGQVSVSGTLFNEWNAGLAALTQVTLLNSDIETHDIQLKIQLKSANGHPFLSAETEVFKVAPGVMVFNGISMSVLNAPEGPEVSSMKNLGVLPYGSYFYCVQVVQNGTEELDHWCDNIQSEYTEFLNLVYPFDGDSIATDLPVLSWMNSSGKINCNHDAEFVIHLVRINKGQTPMQAMNNNPFIWSLNCLSSFQVNYPLTAVQLEEGCAYAWQVNQLYRGRVVNTSEVWHFVMKKNPETRDIKYVHVQKGDNPNYIPVYEKLYIRFDDGYSQGDIHYSLLNKDGQPLELGVRSEWVKGTALCKGFNTYEIDVTAFALPKGFYSVLLTNSKLDQFRLKIEVL